MATIIDTIFRIKDQATAPLKSIQNSMAETGKINQRMGRSLTKTGKSITSISKSIGKFALAGGGLLAATIIPAMQFENVMADVRKVVDFDTPQQFKEMQEDIIALSQKIPMAASELAEIVAAGGQAGIARDELIGFTKDAAMMGVAFGISAKEAGDAMAKWRTAFSMTQKQVVALADQINYLSDTTPATAQQITNIVNRIGPLSGVAGVASGELAAMGATLAGMAIEESVAATGLKNLFIAMNKGASATKKQKNAFAALGFSAEEMAVKMQKDAGSAIIEVMNAINKLPKYEQTAILTQLFGNESVAAIAPLLTNTDALVKNLKKVADASIYAGSMQKEFEVRSATTANALLLAKNGVTAIAVTLGSELLPPLASILKEFAQVAAQIASWMKENPELTKQIVKIATGVVIAAGGISLFGMTIGKLLTTSGSFITTIGKIGIGMKTAGGLIPFLKVQFSGLIYLFKLIGIAAKALFLNPVGLSIMAAVAIGYLLINHWDTVKAFFIGIFETLANAWGAIIGGFVNHFVILFEGIKTIFGGIIEFLAGVFTLDWERAWQGIVTVFGGIFGTIEGICNNVLNAIKAAINAVIGGINGISFTVPSWVPAIGGSQFSPDIPLLAKGTGHWLGGAAMIHDKGAEIVDLPSGSRVVPHDKSLQQEYQRGQQANNNSNFTLNKIADTVIVREEADIDKIVNKLSNMFKASSINQMAGAL